MDITIIIVVAWFILLAVIMYFALRWTYRKMAQEEKEFEEKHGSGKK